MPAIQEYNYTGSLFFHCFNLSYVFLFSDKCKFCLWIYRSYCWSVTMPRDIFKCYKLWYSSEIQIHVDKFSLDELKHTSF